MSDSFTKDSVSFDYNTFSIEKISYNFYDWYRSKFGKNPICLYLNLMSHPNKNDFINFDPLDTSNKLVSGYDTFKEYFPRSEYNNAIEVIGLYLKYLKSLK